MDKAQVTLVPRGDGSSCGGAGRAGGRGTLGASRRSSRTCRCATRHGGGVERHHLGHKALGLVPFVVLRPRFIVAGLQLLLHRDTHSAHRSAKHHEALDGLRRDVLAAFLTFLPLSQVCLKMRPYWDSSC